MLTIEEAKALVGTEFTYFMQEGVSVPAFVKKFDPEIGFTCISLDTEFSNGWKPAKYQTSIEEDGTFCVVSNDLRNPKNRKLRMEQVLDALTRIRDTGEYRHAVSRGVPACSFK